MKIQKLIPCLIFFAIIYSSAVSAQELNQLLIKQLEYSHNQENWFPPTSVAVAGLTVEQANWKDGSDNHSISQLVGHLVFWNERFLSALKGEKVAEFTEDNSVTFDQFEEEEWANLVKKMDQVFTEIELEAGKLEGENLLNWAETLANISAHNAYHTGQLVFIRKQNGWWRE